MAVLQRLRSVVVVGRHHGSRQRRRTSSLALAAALSACASGPPPAPVAAHEGQEPPNRRLEVPESARIPDRGGPTGNPLDEVRARNESQSILADLSQTRELGVRGRFDVKVISRDGIRAFARESMYEKITPEELALLTRVETSFGVLPVGSDGEQVLLDLLESGVLGLYDPKRETLFVGDFVPEAMLSMVVGHEIAHGLQDMHFDLESLQEPIRHESDAETARTYLIEGDAQASYLAWISGAEGLAAVKDEVLHAMGNLALNMPESTSPYPILARQLQLPYADGAATVAKLARNSGWGAVDGLYRELPTTTEQMLHIEKLVSREPAVPIAIDPAPLIRLSPGLRQVHHDTLGEAALLSMIAAVTPPNAARRACAGWGGGRYVVLDRDDKLPAPFVAGLLAWDTAADAEEFLPAFSRYLDGHVEGDYLLERDDNRVWFALRIPPGIDGRDLTTALRNSARAPAQPSRPG